MGINQLRLLTVNWHLVEAKDEGTDGTNKERCLKCSNIMTRYKSKYIDDAYVHFCYPCKELKEDFDYLCDSDGNLCPYCELPVRFEDEDYNNFVNCKDEYCDKKSHLNCIDVCNSCRVWACDDHESNYVDCDHCGLNHSEDCIVSYGGDFSDALGRMCEDCLCRYDDISKVIKKPIKPISTNTDYENVANNNFDYVNKQK